MTVTLLGMNDCRTVTACCTTFAPEFQHLRDATLGSIGRMLDSQKGARLDHRATTFRQLSLAWRL